MSKHSCTPHCDVDGAFSACAANPAKQGTDPTVIETASATLTDLPAGVTAHVAQVGADEVVTFSNTDTSSVAARDAEAPIPQLINPRFTVALSFLNSCQVNGSKVTWSEAVCDVICGGQGFDDRGYCLPYTAIEDVWCAYNPGQLFHGDPRRPCDSRGNATWQTRCVPGWLP